VRHQQASAGGRAQARLSAQAHHAAGAASLRGRGARQRRLGGPDYLHAHRFDAHFQRSPRGRAQTHSDPVRQKLRAGKAEHVSLEDRPERVRRYLRRDLFQLYSLIWDRFVASQMVPAVYDQTAFEIPVNEALFRATGQQIKFDGFMKVYIEGRDERAAPPNGEDEDIDEAQDLDGVLPDLQKGDALKLLSMEPRQHFTQPPPRFTQASLIKELDENGIGRPSTYAAIISNILDREYVSQNESRQLVPTDLGFLVTDLLVESFPDILNVEFTASMEDELDKIEDGKEKWTRAMKRFYTPFE